MDSKPNIFEYSNFRIFLRDYYSASKAQNRNFSFRVFSRMAGFQSPNFLKLVFDGKRNLTEDSLPKFVKALRLNREEAQFFYHLVQLNQAKSALERQKHAYELARSKMYRKLHPLTETQMLYYSHWYYAPIRELVLMNDFQENPEWIARKLKPVITPGEAKKALELLLKLGLLARNSNGQLVQSSPNVTSADEVASTYLVQFHKEFSKRAHDALDLFPFTQREISSVTVGITLETAKKIKEKIKNFRKELVVLCSENEQVETVFQINLQLFPLIQTKEEI